MSVQHPEPDLGKFCLVISASDAQNDLHLWANNQLISVYFRSMDIICFHSLILFIGKNIKVTEYYIIQIITDYWFSIGVPIIWEHTNYLSYVLSVFSDKMSVLEGKTYSQRHKGSVTGLKLPKGSRLVRSYLKRLAKCIKKPFCITEENSSLIQDWISRYLG